MNWPGMPKPTRIGWSFRRPTNFSRLPNHSQSDIVFLIDAMKWAGLELGCAGPNNLPDTVVTTLAVTDEPAG